MEPALSAAAFLTESIAGGPSTAGRLPGEPNWALPQELRAHVDAAVGQLGQRLVEVRQRPSMILSNEGRGFLIQRSGALLP